MNEKIEKEIVNLFIDDILPNRFQPRLTFDEKALNELADSIRQHGIIQPLVVRKLNDKYEVTFNVPSITDQTQNIKLLLVNKEGEVYGVKIIEPKDINWETKEITVEFDELETNGFISFVADIAE